MTTENKHLQPLSNSGLRRGVPPLAQARTEALACRSVHTALAAPTMRQLGRENGDEAVMVEATAILETGFQMFDPKRRMPPQQVTFFAEDMVERYPHESLADLNVFMRGCILSKYDQGEFYSSVDIPRLHRWWKTYLEEKAAALEETVVREDHFGEQAAKEAIAAIPGLGAAVQRFSLEGKAKAIAEGKIARMTKLKTDVEKMGDQELRDMWHVYPTAEERSVILQEAIKRGLLGPEYQQPDEPA